MVCIVADSNVVISGYHFRGTPARVLDMAVSGEIEMAISEFILSEVMRNLRDKLGWPEAKLYELEAVITRYAKKVSPSEILDIVKADPTDNRILECALAAEATYVVTGDKHLLKLKQFRNIEIATSADFLQALRQR